MTEAVAHIASTSMPIKLTRITIGVSTNIIISALCLSEDNDTDVQIKGVLANMPTKKEAATYNFKTIKTIPKIIDIKITKLLFTKTTSLLV